MSYLVLPWIGNCDANVARVKLDVDGAQVVQERRKTSAVVSGAHTHVVVAIAVTSLSWRGRRDLHQ